MHTVAPAHGLGLSPKKMALVDRFLKTVSHGRYAPQSATIQGILKSMYDSFTETLESSTAAEATANSNFESIIAALQKELASLTAVLEEKQLSEATQAFEGVLEVEEVRSIMVASPPSSPPPSPSSPPPPSPSSPSPSSPPSPKDIKNGKGDNVSEDSGSGALVPVIVILAVLVVLVPVIVILAV